MKILFACCLFTLVVHAHPVHVSTTDIVYNSKTGSLEISIKVFLDDLESIIQTTTEREIYFDSEQALSDNAKYLEDYVRTHFKIWVADSLQNYIYIGQELQDEFVWIYLELPAIKVHQSFELQQSILTDLMAEQSNYVHFYSPKQQSFIFNRRRLRRVVVW